MTSMNRTPNLLGFLKRLAKDLSTEKWRKYELLNVAREYSVVDGTIKAVLKLGIVRKREPSGYFKNCTYLLGPAWEGNDVDTLLHKVEAEIPAFKAPRVLADATPDSITVPEEPEYAQAMKEANREVFGASQPKEEVIEAAPAKEEKIKWFQPEQIAEMETVVNSGEAATELPEVKEMPEPSFTLSEEVNYDFPKIPQEIEERITDYLEKTGYPAPSANFNITKEQADRILQIATQEKPKATYSIFGKDGKDLLFIENGFLEASEAIDYVQDYIMENPNQVFVVVKTVAEFEAVVSVRKRFTSNGRPSN